MQEAVAGVRRKKWEEPPGNDNKQSKAPLYWKGKQELLLKEQALGEEKSARPYVCVNFVLPPV